MNKLPKFGTRSSENNNITCRIVDGILGCIKYLFGHVENNHQTGKSAKDALSSPNWNKANEYSKFDVTYDNNTTLELKKPSSKYQCLTCYSGSSFSKSVEIIPLTYVRRVTSKTNCNMHCETVKNVSFEDSFHSKGVNSVTNHFVTHEERFERIRKVCIRVHFNISETCSILDTFGNCNYSTDGYLITTDSPVVMSPSCSKNSPCKGFVEDKKNRKHIEKNVKIYNLITDEFVQTMKTVKKILEDLNFVDTDKFDLNAISNVLRIIIKHQSKLLSIIIPPNDKSEFENSRPDMNFSNYLKSEESIYYSSTNINYTKKPANDIKSSPRSIKDHNLMINNRKELIKK